MAFTLDSGAFAQEAVSEEIRAQNAEIRRKLSELPDPWAFPPSVVREARKAGRGIFPIQPPSLRAETVEIGGPRGPIPLRILRPRETARGVFLHFHFGGWTLGSADMHDDYFERIAEAGFAVVSVDYRLAPEWPYPSGPDDCEAAALWLVREAKARFGTDHLVIGGESAGAHLSVVTLVRLRDRHGLRPFASMVLNAGCYDLAGTPSVKAATSPDKLILNRRDIENFVRCFVPAGVPLGDPDISPLYADLTALPPALVLIGTADPLVDDSMFMASRLNAAGVPVELHVFPGGCHVFQMFPSALTDECLGAMMRFLAG